MKWFVAIALTMFAGTAPAEVLTEENIPKFDGATACAADPAASSTVGYKDQCQARNAAMRAHLIGRDIDPRIIEFCAADARLHNAPARDEDFGVCVQKELGRPILNRIEEMVRTAPSICDATSGELANSQCEVREIRMHETVKEDPERLSEGYVMPCVEDLARREILGWLNIVNCEVSPRADAQ